MLALFSVDKYDKQHLLHQHQIVFQSLMDVLNFPRILGCREREHVFFQYILANNNFLRTNLNVWFSAACEGWWISGCQLVPPKIRLSGTKQSSLQKGLRIYTKLSLRKPFTLMIINLQSREDKSKMYPLWGPDRRHNLTTRDITRNYFFRLRAMTTLQWATVQQW